MGYIIKPSSLSGLDELHFKFEHCNKDDKRLFIVFGARGAKPGAFGFYKTFVGLRLNTIFVTGHEDKWYQNGIPSLGDDLESAMYSFDIRVKGICQELGFSSVTLIGSSMGGYLSLVYASLSDIKISMDAIIMGTETELFLPYSKSIESPFSALKDYSNIKFKNYNNRPITMIFGEFDLVDSYCALSMKIHSNFTILSHVSSGHVLPEVIDSTIGISDFFNDIINNKARCFIGMGNMSNFLSPSDIEPLIKEQQFSKLYIECLEACLRKYPAFGFGWNRLGVYLHNNGDLIKAREAIKKSLLINMNYKNSISHLNSIESKLI